jgi:hypothetical protein
MGFVAKPLVNITATKEIIYYDTVSKKALLGSVTDMSGDISTDGYAGSIVFCTASEVLILGALNDPACYAYNFYVEGGRLTQIAPMHRGRGFHGGVYSKHTKRAYVFAGIGTEGSGDLFCEAYSVELSTWAPMEGTV